MLQTITRGAIDVWARTARLPLRAAEAVVRPEDGETWRPALAFEQAEASVRSALGGLLRDPALKASADRQRTRVAKLQEAVRKQAQADVLERRADEQLSEATKQVAAERSAANRRAEKAEEAVERREKEATAKARKDEATRKQAVAKAAAAHERQIEREQAEAERTRLAKEAEALAQERDALAAESEALRLEDEAEKVKARRKPAI